MSTVFKLRGQTRTLRIPLILAWTRCERPPRPPASLPLRHCTRIALFFTRLRGRGAASPSSAHPSSLFCPSSPSARLAMFLSRSAFDDAPPADASARPKTGGFSTVSRHAAGRPGTATAASPAADEGVGYGRHGAVSVALSPPRLPCRLTPLPLSLTRLCRRARISSVPRRALALVSCL